nr:MAG: hypothetical protein DIU80_12990 [Chloroflexota bacterium]
MDIGRAFGFVTKDESWITKVLIGGLVSFIPFIGQFTVMGYGYRVAKNVAAGSERPLPEWGEFGDFLTRGFLAWVIQLVYLIPLLLLYFIFMFATVGTAMLSDSEGASGPGALIGLCLMPLLFIVALVCGVASLGGVARYLATDEFSQAFRFGEVFANLRANLGTYVMVILIAILAGLAASIGLIACGIGVLFTSFYAQLVFGHALGQALPQLYPARGFQGPAGIPPTTSF